MDAQVDPVAIQTRVKTTPVINWWNAASARVRSVSVIASTQYVGIVHSTELLSVNELKDEKTNYGLRNTIGLFLERDPSFL